MQTALLAMLRSAPILPLVKQVVVNLTLGRGMGMSFRTCLEA